MRGRLPQVALAVALGVVSGVYIYRPLFQPPGPPRPSGGTAGPSADSAPEKNP